MMTNPLTDPGRQCLSMSSQAAPEFESVHLGRDRPRSRDFSCATDAVVDGRFAEIPLVPCRLRERIISNLLLPFPVGPGTGEERHDRTFMGDASNPSARRGARYSPRTILRQASTFKRSSRIAIWTLQSTKRLPGAQNRRSL
jgi:hypothetical protein